jgi:hypothetical protein
VQAEEPVDPPLEVIRIARGKRPVLLDILAMNRGR